MEVTGSVGGVGGTVTCIPVNCTSPHVCFPFIFTYTNPVTGATFITEECKCIIWDDLNGNGAVNWGEFEFVEELGALFDETGAPWME